MKHYLSFPNQQPDEQLVFVLRRHWVTFSRRVVMFKVLFLAPVAIFFFSSGRILGVLTDRGLIGVLLVMAASLYYLYLGLYFFHAWIDYYLDVWIVTSKRVVNIEQHGLFSRVVSELQLDSIEDVTVEVHGVLPTVLKYGDVHIQTAAETSRFLFDDIRNPYDVARKIIQLRDAAINTSHTGGKKHTVAVSHKENAA